MQTTVRKRASGKVKRFSFDPGRRGRLSGQPYSYADRRLLEYLFLVSVKYGVSRGEFFNHLVEASENGRSAAGNLAIECRVKAVAYVVFLLEYRYEPVAQFRMPIHLLKESRPFEGFVHFLGTPEAGEEKKCEAVPLRIRDLKVGMKQVNLEAKVLGKSSTRRVYSRYTYEAHLVAVAVIGDGTGSVKLTLWDNQIDEALTGDTVRIENGYVQMFKGGKQLSVRKKLGKISVVKA